MNHKGKITKEEAFLEACKRNGLIYTPYPSGVRTDSITLMNEKGQEFALNEDMTVKLKETGHQSNDLAATMEEPVTNIKIKKTDISKDVVKIPDFSAFASDSAKAISKVVSKKRVSTINRLKERDMREGMQKA